MSIIPYDFTKDLSLQSHIFESLKAFTLSQKIIHPHNLTITPNNLSSQMTTPIQESKWMNLYSPMPIASTWNNSSPMSPTQTPPTSPSTTEIQPPPTLFLTTEFQIPVTAHKNQIKPQETSNILSIQQAISSQNLITYWSSNMPTIMTTKLESPKSTSSIHYQQNNMITRLEEIRTPEMFHL